ncbi:GRAM domain-containing protein 4-like [Watersipora subatra]|uniref:GRAM domain-containing protein 4-like n=1 Tax=Watersipora subatra TaxID=2589382 RepID=UPI00355AFE98
MASAGGATSLRSRLKDKIINSAIGGTVTDKIHSIMKHDLLSENASTNPDMDFHFTPSHHRSPSIESAGSDKSSVKDLGSGGASVDSTLVSPISESEFVEGSTKGSRPPDIFEQQLVQLQEQLVSAMIENQNLAAELEEIKNDRELQKLQRELQVEKRRNNELLSKIAGIAHQTSSQHPAEEQPDRVEPSAPAVEPETLPDEACRHSWVDWLIHSVLQKYYDVVEDFSVTADDIEKKEVLEPLSVKSLKLNVRRFSAGVSPIWDLVSSFYLLFNWHSPLLTATVFSVYLYICWVGYLIPGILFVLLLWLLLNLLEESKFLSRMHFLPRKVKHEPEERETSVSDKFNIVLDVATKVQNKFGHMADGLEKFKNLFTWKRPEDTNQIFIPICILFFLSLFLQTDTIVRILGILIGFKLFIINPVYDRFPRVKQRYDGTSRLYSNLVTDAELEKQKLRKANNQLVLPKNQMLNRSLTDSSRHNSTLSEVSSSEQAMTEEDRSFCERFHLPDEERPISNTPFKGGRHCIYLSNMSSLSLSAAYNKHAKLYLTPSFLCYELVRQEARKAIPLASITRVDKKKPVTFLPGNGMSLEIAEEGFERPHVFGGLLHRDDCYQTLLEIGRRNQLQYALSHEHLASEIRLSDLADPDDDLGEASSTTAS